MFIISDCGYSRYLYSPMSKANKQPPPIFWISELAFLILAGWCIIQSVELSKPKTQMSSITGRIALLTNHYQNLEDHHRGKMRFIKLINDNRVFDFFTGHDRGDFAPQTEKLGSLKEGDIITMYYIRNMFQADSLQNHTIQYVDKGKQTVYAAGSTIKTLLLCLAMVCALCMGGLFVLKNEGYII